MRYQIYGALVVTGFFAIAATGSPVFATPPDGRPFITLAQAQQPTSPAPTPAPAAGAQQQPSGTSTNMPGQMMEKEKGMGEMGKSMSPSMGGMPPCPAGQAMSGTPPACR